jgi:hypothetical protein
MVEQEVLAAMAEAAPLEPVKVQLDARRSSAEATVGTMSVAGAAWTEAAPRRAMTQSLMLGTMVGVIKRECIKRM